MAGGQQAPAAPPADPVLARGRAVFVREPCAFCHTVRGADAAAAPVPDLTHLASRATLAAGTLPNTRGHSPAGCWTRPPASPARPCLRWSFPPMTSRRCLAWMESLK
jgi:cytochrome c oxidase subunit 2